MAQEKYHVNTDTGRAGKCTATKQKCPYGGEDGLQNHFATKDEAKQNRERIMEELHGDKEAAVSKSASAASAYDPQKTPFDVDTKIMEVLGEMAKSENSLSSAIGKLRETVGDRGKGSYEGNKYVRTYLYNNREDLLEAVAKKRKEQEELYATEVGDEKKYAQWRIDRIDKQIQELEESEAKKNALINKKSKLERVFNEHQWSRFFLVADGHIHSSMHCSTCNKGMKATDFYWQPQLSGKSEEEAVAEHGSRLCTVCYPSAPVEWTNFKEQEAAAKKAAQCQGSGTQDYIDGSTRFGYYTGNGGKCKHCGGWVSVKSKNNYDMRAHKPKE